MNIPKFELTSIFTDGTEEEPQIFPVEKLPWEETSTSRRGFLGAGLTATVILGMKKLLPAAAFPAKGSSIRAHETSIHSLCFSRDGKTLVSIARGDLKLWSMPSLKYKARVAIKDTVWDVAVSPDNSSFALYLSKHIELRSLKDGALIKKTEAPLPKDKAKGLAFTADGKKLLAFSETVPGVTALNMNTWRMEQYIPGAFMNEIKALVCSPDGQAIVALETGIDRQMQLMAYDAKKGELIRVLEDVPSIGYPWRLLISPNGKRLFFINEANPDESLQIWELGAWKKSFVYSIGLNNHFAVSPAGDKIFSNSQEREVIGWEAPLISENQLNILDLLVVTEFEDLKKPVIRLCAHHHDSNIWALAASPGSTLIASGDSDGVIRISDWSKKECLGYLYDPKVNERDGIAYNVYDKLTGQTITYTLPCGSPLPTGAVCTCNCVASTKPVYRPRPTYRSGGTYCSCNKICTCVPVCHAFRLLNKDPLIRSLAKQIILHMGERELPYLRWAAANAGSKPLQQRIGKMITAVTAGQLPDAAAWPPNSIMVPYLNSRDEVTRIMTAQMMMLNFGIKGIPVSHRNLEKIKRLLIRSKELNRELQERVAARGINGEHNSVTTLTQTPM